MSISLFGNVFVVCFVDQGERERESPIEEYSMVSSQKQEPQKQNVSGTIETLGFYNNPKKKKGKIQYIAISNELYKVFMFPIEIF